MHLRLVLIERQLHHDSRGGRLRFRVVADAEQTARLATLRTVRAPAVQEARQRAVAVARPGQQPRMRPAIQNRIQSHPDPTYNTQPVRLLHK